MRHCLALRKVEVVEVVPSFPLPQHFVSVGSDVFQFDVELLVFAALAFAQRRTTDPCVKALAVVFDAAGFATVAAARVQLFDVLLVDLLELGFEGERVLSDGFRNDQLPQLVQRLLIVTVFATALRPAESGRGEALAVELQTLGFAAGASGLLGSALLSRAALRRLWYLNLRGGICWLGGERRCQGLAAALGAGSGLRDWRRVLGPGFRRSC